MFYRFLNPRRGNNVGTNQAKPVETEKTTIMTHHPVRDERKNSAIPENTETEINEPITMDDLPPPGTRRWVTRRKAEVVAGVRSGLISLEDACRRYSLSVEEFLSWQTTLDRHGLRGLRVTRLQEIRGS